jgi:hypothetical protein
MYARLVLRLILAIILIAALIGMGVYLYNMGVAQGMAGAALSIPPDGSATPAYPLYPPFYRPWGFGFFPLGWIFPLFFGLLLIGLFSRLLFSGWRRHGHGHWGGMPEGHRDVPPAVEEWHRRMHGESTNPAKSE